MHDGVGNVGETDVHLASASNAIIIAFNVKVDPAAQRLASMRALIFARTMSSTSSCDDIEAALKGHARAGLSRAGGWPRRGDAALQGWA